MSAGGVRAGAKPPGPRRAATAAPDKSLPHLDVSDIGADAIGFAAPLITLLAIGTLRKGGFFRPDIVVLPIVAVALAASAAPARRWLRTNPVASAAVVLATGWWLIAAIQSRHGVESWRLPATWMCAVAGYGAARGLPPAARRVMVLSVAVLGCAITVAGLTLVGVHADTWTWLDERSLRLAGPLTYPSATGLFLAVALLATIDLWPDDDSSITGRRWAPVVRTLMLVGVVATDSRGAVLGLAVALCFPRVRRALLPAVVAAGLGAPIVLLGQRDGGRPAIIAAGALLALAIAFVPNGVLRGLGRIVAVPAIGLVGWLLLTQHHAVSGLDASWAERGHILRGAVDVLRLHPLFGSGPDPTVAAKTLNGQPGIAYFVHNEPLEILVSIGVVGAAVLVVCAVIVLKALRLSRSQLAAPVLAMVGAAGLVDFVWHFPAFGLLCGVVLGAARHRDVAQLPPDTVVE
ncbi:MAG: hypothetical protein QOE97_2882 [Pseudonocardiales bacterium]|nr:hypothetical protein [Pseudonocardiales bacterium]